MTHICVMSSHKPSLLECYEKVDEGIVRGDYVPKQREVEGAEEEEKEEEEEEEEEGGDDYGDTILQLTSSGSLKGVSFCR